MLDIFSLATGARRRGSKDSDVDDHSQDQGHPNNLTLEREETAPKHLYHGHRRNSWVSKDIDELTEVRARQRTFEGAYQRTALGMATYAIVVLKIFSSDFARIGILYVAMAVLMIIFAFIRRRRSDHDFADAYRSLPPGADPNIPVMKGGKRLWGRQFKTVGNLVIFLSCCVAALELAIFVLLMRL